MMQDNFWSEIKPYIDLLSLYKNEGHIGSNGNRHVPELERIINTYITPERKKKFCFGCKMNTGMKMLINYYEQTPKRGRKRKL